MNFESELEVRQNLIQFLAIEKSLQEFEDWFVPRSWGFKVATPSLQQLVSEIELRLAEYSNGDWTLDELRQKLIPLVTTYDLDYRFEDDNSPIVRTGSNAQESRPIDPQTSFDIPVVMEFA